MNSKPYDVAIIGGGIIGMATAMALTESYRLSLVVLEAEDRVAAHQSGHNSGVIHSGLYYKPGSLKARNCVEGRELLYRFCQENGVSYERCGKIVVATRESELPALDELERRGRANALIGLRRLGPAEIREYEPAATGISGLSVPETGIVDFAAVTRAYATRVRQRGGEVRLGTRLRRCRRRPDELVLETTRGDVRCRHLINCGGLWADRVARLCGVEPGVDIVPFRGEYHELAPRARSLVRGLIYPVPDPRFPFLGVHFTRTIHGGVEAGPNAILALSRRGYSAWSVCLRDALEMVTYGGFWRLAVRYWKTGVGEVYRSLNKPALARALQRLVPAIRTDDLRLAGAGVRAQAVDPSGALVDDFHIVEAERMIHVLNAPSPAATASISIGRMIAGMAGKAFDLRTTTRESYTVPPAQGPLQRRITAP
jgi:L-2-hydroxyglutarate oxidase